MNLIVFFTKVYVFCYRKIHKITDQVTTTPPGSSQNNPLVIIYRISDTGYPKIKPTYINNENCLRNAVKRFPVNRCQWLVIADNICEETYAMICQYIPIDNIQRVSIGHGAGTFRLAMNTALTYPDTTIVYFLENDYLHREHAMEVLLEGFTLPHCDYVSLYDHPDKYTKTHFVARGGERTNVFLTASSHWKISHSTTMTFATRVKTLKQDRHIFRRWTQTSHPFDLEIFINLDWKGRKLLLPIPGYATHGDTDGHAPLHNWSTEIE